MIFAAARLRGAWLIEPAPREDERGFFARTWCAEEFADRGLNPRVAECSISFTMKKGTLRGLHYQVAPHAGVQLVRCTAGAIFDVILDLRPVSPTFRQHVAVTLTADDRTMLYVPEGVAHGFQTLEDDTEVFHQFSAPYVAAAARGIRWDDPAFGIRWPPDERTISEQDRTYPDFVSRSVSPASEQFPLHSAPVEG